MSLELGVFGFELVDVFFVVFLGFLFAEGEVIEGVHDFGSKFVQGINDLSEGVLIGEVLVGGK